MYSRGVKAEEFREWAERNPERYEQLRKKVQAEQLVKQYVKQLEAERQVAFRRAQEARISRVDVALVTTVLPTLDFPDVHGVVALRRWQLELHRGLVSAAMRTVWTEVMIADMLPAPDNDHGLYGIKLSPEHLVYTASSYASAICGLIEMRGRIVEHLDGVMRAEWARILCIFVGAESYEIYEIMDVLHRRYPYVPKYVLSRKQLAHVLFREALRQYSVWE